MTEFTMAASEETITITGIVALSLLVPLIAGSYLIFRLAFRLDDLQSFFAHPRIRRAYLTSKGHFLRRENEKEIEETFAGVFTKQGHREFGKYRFVFAAAIEECLEKC